jgi:hypothetical protein
MINNIESSQTNGWRERTLKFRRVERKKDFYARIVTAYWYAGRGNVVRRRKTRKLFCWWICWFRPSVHGGGCRIGLSYRDES